MSREELINKILDLRPSILSKAELDKLSTDTLASLYSANCNLSFYSLTKKNILVGIIHTFFGDDCPKEILLNQEIPNILNIYLNEIRMVSQECFQQEMAEHIKKREEEAVENEDDLYLGYTDTEKKLDFYVSLQTSELEIVSDVIRRYGLKIMEVNEEIKSEEAELEFNENCLDDDLRYDQKKEFLADIDKNRSRLIELKTILDAYITLKSVQEDRLVLLRSDQKN